MILNVSGRTDVVAFYTPWFIKRYQEGFVDVRNPFHHTLINRIYFEHVDAIVFCTKNPIPILDFLPKIQKPILFHVTLTPYKKDIEPNVPPKGLIIKAIKKVSNIIGIESVVVRYDPIFLSDKYHLEYHKKAFENMCTMLEGYVKTIIVSFMDDYKNVQKNKYILKHRVWTEQDYHDLGISFSASAKKHGMTVQTCCEERNLTEYGFQKGDCVSHELAYKMTKKTYKTWKARNKNCQCVELVDIGVYNSCQHFCKYCYANYDEKKVNQNIKKHHPNSTLLIGEIEKSDIIKVRV